MTHEQFCWWLEGFLDGGADIDLDVRSQIREKMELVGAAPAKVQPSADRPKTPSIKVDGDGYVRGYTGLEGSVLSGFPVGGIAHCVSDATLAMTSPTIAAASTRMTP